MWSRFSIARSRLSIVEALDTAADLEGYDPLSVDDLCFARMTRSEVVDEGPSMAICYPAGIVLAYRHYADEGTQPWDPEEPTHRVVALLGKRVLEWRPYDWYRRPLEKRRRSFSFVKIQPLRDGRVVYGTEEEEGDPDMTWLFVGVDVEGGRELWYKRRFVWASDELTALRFPRRFEREKAWQYTLDLESIGFQNTALDLKPVSPLSREDLGVWRVLGSIPGRYKDRY